MRETTRHATLGNGEHRDELGLVVGGGIERDLEAREDLGGDRLGDEDREIATHAETKAQAEREVGAGLGLDEETIGIEARRISVTSAPELIAGVRNWNARRRERTSCLGGSTIRVAITPAFALRK